MKQTQQHVQALEQQISVVERNNEEKEVSLPSPSLAEVFPSELNTSYEQSKNKIVKEVISTMEEDNRKVCMCRVIRIQSRWIT